MKTLIVDDERLARAELRRLLADFEDLEIVGEAENGEQALAKVDALQPGLIFLDIQMPGINGLDVLNQIPPPRPHIIFTTAHDEYAVQAFEFSATDYLLKPVDPDRLRKALHKIHISDQELTEDPNNPNPRTRRSRFY
jgi:two-component system, LytTR family, response regulator